jgi:hypothetical protein
MHKILLIISSIMIDKSENIHANFRFIEPVEVAFEKHSVFVKSFSFTFPVKVKWYSHIATINASLGIYDYIRGRIRMAPGQSQYMINNLNIYDGIPIDFIPDQKEFGLGLQPGEVDINLMLLEGLDVCSEDQIPSLNPLITPEDLDLKIT